jgi:hypothetical protein
MFNIAWTASALHDLRFFEKREQRIIADGIDEQLLHEPLTKTRNCKPLRPNSLENGKSDWVIFACFTTQAK